MARGKYGGSILLFIILAVFCMLAIVEIFHGREQIRMEGEKQTVEEKNNQARQELISERDNLEGDPNGGAGSVDSEGEENEGDGGSDSAEKKYDMQIVCLGDGILDRDRENGGVAALISDACNARIYNMAIDGTTAALLPDEQYNFEAWDSRSLLGVVNAIVGNIDPDIFDGYRAGEILEECDFSETDYFVIEYGINDFLNRQIPQSKYMANDVVLDMDGAHTYVGALETAVGLLQSNFPTAKILLIAPHFCQIFEDGTFIGDSYSLDYGYGTMVDFHQAAGYVANQDKEGSIIFYNTIDKSGINAYTAGDYLQDGIHLSAEGRRAYADYASTLIKADFYREE